MKFTLIKSIFLSAFIIGSCAVKAAPVYMVGYAEADLISYENGMATVISNPQDSLLRNGLAYNPFDEIMYGLNQDDVLYQIDLVTGLRSFITALVPTDFITGLAFDTGTQTLYTAARSPAESLAAINVVTGVVTTIGAFNNSQFLIDISMDSNNNLYGVGINGALFSIDKNTGNSTILFNDVTANLGGIDRGFTGFAIDENDDFYGVTIAGDKLVKIDTVLGTSSVIFDMTPFERDVRGMSFARDIQAVSSPSVFAIFTLGLMGLASRRFKK